jgi:hypothetical protein
MVKNTRALRAGFAAVLVMAVAFVPAALAGRGGTHGSAAAADPNLTLSAASVAAGDPFQASGCGYTQRQPVNVTIDSPSAEYFFPTAVDRNGCVSFGFWTSEPGQYTVNAYQSGNAGKQTLLASALLTAS